jgi:hypothetical protein
MKTKNKLIITAMALLVIITMTLALFACEEEDPKCTCPEGTTHEPNVKCCEGTDCNCKIAEPTKKSFTSEFDFQNPINALLRYSATIKDERTACGSADLEHVEVGEGEDKKSIVTIIEEAVQGAFDNNATTDMRKDRFRDVFSVSGRVQIIVNNTTPTYKMRAPDKSTIYFHIDYLKSSPPNIQQKVFDAVTAMNDGGENLPYEAE